jgi:predicted AAA+ superfamily ATPase
MFSGGLVHQAGGLVNYSSIASKINTSPDTVRRWINTLESLFFCYTIRPWHVNIAKSLRKQPKIYLWDWSLVPDQGGRYENFVASHLLKAVHFWTDTGMGEYRLFFIRDKTGREVDFLIVRDNVPWIMIDVKSSGSVPLSRHLALFKKKTGAEYAFQVSMDSEYVDADCFSEREPVRVPARTFLSQLV